jgi:hypothetical protein
MKEKKVRVLEAIRQGLIGGGETHVLELVAKLDKSAFQPIVLSFTDGPMVTTLTYLFMLFTVKQDLTFLFGKK